MALSPSEKHRYAWEFLKRHPRYREWWSQFVAADRKARNNMFTTMRTRLRGTTLPIEKKKFAFRRRFLAQFGIADFYDPAKTPSARELSKLFSTVKPVGEVVPGTEPSETQLHLSIDISAPQRDILEMVRELVSKKQKKCGVKPRLKFPRESDLQVYLLILDSYKEFQKKTGASVSNKFNWTKFADHLNAKLNRPDSIIDPNELSRTHLKQAFQFRDQAPFSILRNYK